MTTTTTDAVQLDVGALANWLTARAGTADTPGELMLDPTFGQDDEEFEVVADDLLTAMQDPDAADSPLTLDRNVVTEIVFRRAGSRDEDGGLVLVDLANGVRLACMHQDRGDLVAETTGVEAAGELVREIVRVANDLIDQARRAVWS